MLINGTEDLRIQKTMSAIKESFEALICEKEYNEIMFLREVTHSINAYNDISDVIRLYSKSPEKASERLANLMADFGSDEE